MGSAVPLFPEPRHTDRQPPYAAEAEISVLGAMLIDADAVGKVAELQLTPGDFYREGHRRIAAAMLRVYERGDVPDATVLAEELKQTGELEQAGGLPYLAELLDAVPTAANVAYHARIVRERAVMRRLIEAASATIQDVYDPGERSVDDLLDHAERRVMEVGDRRTAGRLVRVGENLAAAAADLEERTKTGGITGVSTGFKGLDYRTGGLQKSDMILLAARPSMGKTALVMQIVQHVAENVGPVAFFSADMSFQQLRHRLISSETLIPVIRLLRGDIRDEEYPRIQSAFARLKSLPIWIDDAGGQTVLGIRAKARRMAQRDGVALIVVDFIQKLRGTGQENRQQEMTSISGGLKDLAKELDVPMVALSQLSRQPEQRADRRPQLSDLRESGSLEQDADLVMMLHRPDYYLKDADALSQGVKGAAELDIQKQRQGPTGTLNLHWREELLRFEELVEERHGTR